MGWNDHCNMIEMIMEEEEATGLDFDERYMVAVETVSDMIRDGEHSCARDCH